MQFEFDQQKRELNKKKHGIDFVEAQARWDDLDLIEIPVKVSGESRFLVVGKIAKKKKHWSVWFINIGNTFVQVHR
jgi:uncharacterized DUF497 family protein